MQLTGGDRRKAEIGGRIKARREHSARTLEQLAAAAGVHKNTLGNIERGKSKPGEATLLKIADALGCTVDEMVGAAPAQPPAESSIAAFLENYQHEHPESFAGWTSEMATRYFALGVRRTATSDEAARHVAKRVAREFECINRLRDLFDADEEHRAVGHVFAEHDRWRETTERANSGNGRVDPAHDLPATHRAANLATV